MPTYIQVNANRSAAAMDLAWATAAKHDAQLLLISEPNKAAIKGTRWYKDKRGDAAIGYLGPKTPVTATGAGNGFVWVIVDGMAIYSCYISPNVNLEAYEHFVNDLNIDIIGNSADRYIVIGDFNSKSPVWGSRVQDARGDILGDMFCALGMVCLNEWGVYTFIRRGSGSTIDITAVSENLISESIHWRVLANEDSLSPHLYIEFNVGRASVSRPLARWVQGPIDRERLSEELSLCDGVERPTVENLVATVKGAYSRSIHNVRMTSGRIPYWWSAEIANLRAASITSRRNCTRIRGRVGTTEDDINRAEESYRTAKKNLRVAIVRAKKRCWENLISEVDNDVYGQGYRIVTKALKVLYPPLALTKEEKDEQVSRLFPVAAERLWERAPVEDIPLFTEEELFAAASKLKNGKAPGRDGLSAEAIKIAVREITGYFLSVLNDLLRAGSFPEVWKEAKLVLVEKEEKGPLQIPALRPLCLTDALAKLYEHLLLKRLVEEIDAAGGLSEQQHGFRKKHSTVGAVLEVLRHATEAHRSAPSRWCMVVFIDVKNAFNTAAWHKIIYRLEEYGVSTYLMNVIKDYLTGRVIWKNAREKTQINVGVPQGSVLGPTLWDVMYDGVMRLAAPDGVRFVGYADDLAIVVVDKNLERLTEKANQTIELAREWLEENELQMAPEKTEAILLRFGRRRQAVAVEVDGMRVEVKDTARYLGITLDSAVSFGPHVRAVATKAEKTITALSRLMPNVGGPGEERRRILCSVAHSVMLYGAPIWAGSLQVASYRRRLQAVQRKMALRICRAYRTVSYDAATVLASVMPIHLMAAERKNIYDRSLVGNADRGAEHSRMLDRWQEEWANGTKGPWTRRLIRDVRPWVTWKHGEMDFHLTQAMSGHGAFKAYTFRIGKSVGDLCEHCEVPDTAEHALFNCALFDNARREVSTRLGEAPNVGNMVNLMLETKEAWEAMRQYASAIMAMKEGQERQRI